MTTENSKSEEIQETIITEPKNEFQNKKIRLLQKSNCYFGEKDFLKDFKEFISCIDRYNISKEDNLPHENQIIREFDKTRDKIKLLLKKYLELDNVSFLFGTGPSLMLGAESISDIPQKVETAINKEKSRKNTFKKLIKYFQNKAITQKDIDKSKENNWFYKQNEDGIYKYFNSEKDKFGNIVAPLEKFTDFLLGLLFIGEYSESIKINKDVFKKKDLEDIFQIMKYELFKLCDLRKLQEKNNDGSDKLVSHKKFLKALLGRPLNLRRANLFTTNYDLAFEAALDELGINYINGFSGFNNRYFRPEVFDHDMYFPGNTTQGKVRRIEKLIRYYKLHGSLTWVREEPRSNNIYGLREYPIDYIRLEYSKKKEDQMISIGDMMIYPTAYKKGYTLDFPYSELFRQFSAAITQQQSVLFCIGYSFNDEHINDIIYQALSIPSFSLIIVDLNGKGEIEKLKSLKDPRITILTGKYLGNFKYFAEDIMPNFHELGITEEISKTLNSLYPNSIYKDDINV